MIDRNRCPEVYIFPGSLEYVRCHKKIYHKGLCSKSIETPNTTAMLKWRDLTVQRQKRKEKDEKIESEAKG